MTRRVYNFTAGPSMLPLPVLKRVQEEFFDFNGLGASIIEISHLTDDFKALVHDTEALLRELLAIPEQYRIVFAHGGGVMQFSMAPLNLMARTAARKALFVESGYFSQSAAAEAGRYGTAEVIASSRETNFDRIPPFDPAALDTAAAYLHITTNNTMVGTRWHTFPETGELPLVADATSEILSRPMDVSRFGLLYAGVQKNLGPSGVAVVIVREDLLGHALPSTPKMLNYAQLAADHSLSNTANTFAIYVANLVLRWVKGGGGLQAMEDLNERKAALVYDALQRHAGFYTPHAHPAHRSRMNVTFKLPAPELDDAFVAEGNAEGLYALRGHRFFGGIRASLYNAMPLAGAQALADFMDSFARRYG